MYLLVFTVLMIGILGIYTQVAAVEATRLYQSQTGIGQAMLTWHEAAVSLTNVLNPATAAPGGAPVAFAGCSLTTALVLPGYCLTGATLGGAPAQVDTGGGGYALAGATYPFLPVSYAKAAYPWKSLFYQDPTVGSYYVITYVNGVGGGGFVTSASGTSLGITEADLFQQVRNLGLPPYSYGMVSGGKLLIPPITSTGAAPLSVSYIVPVPDGSFAIISSATPCTGC